MHYNGKDISNGSSYESLPRVVLAVVLVVLAVVLQYIIKVTRYRMGHLTIRKTNIYPTM